MLLRSMWKRLFEKKLYSRNNVVVSLQYIWQQQTKGIVVLIENNLVLIKKLTHLTHVEKILKKGYHIATIGT